MTEEPKEGDDLISSWRKPPQQPQAPDEWRLDIDSENPGQKLEDKQDQLSTAIAIIEGLENDLKYSLV